MTNSIHGVRTSVFALVLAVPALATMIGAADGRSARSRAYDGTWNVVFVTRAGNCSSTNSAPFTVQAGDFIPPGVAK